MTPPAPEPFLLLDESLSSGIAEEVRQATGHPIPTVRDEWPGRNFQINRLRDEEIISYLGNKAGHRSLWITGDRKALDEHSQPITDHGISVLLLRGPGRRPLNPREQSQILCAVMERARSLILERSAPVYLRAGLDHLNAYEPFLESLHDTLLNRPMQWNRIPLT